MSHKAIVEKYIDAYNNFNIEDMMSCFLQTASFENVSNASGSICLQGVDEIKKLANKSKEFFISRKQEVLHWHEGKDHVVVEILYKAVLNIDFSDTLKKGNSLELKGVSIFEFKNGKISRLVDFS